VSTLSGKEAALVICGGFICSFDVGEELSGSFGADGEGGAIRRLCFAPPAVIYIEHLRCSSERNNAAISTYFDFAVALGSVELAPPQKNQRSGAKKRGGCPLQKIGRLALPKRKMAFLWVVSVLVTVSWRSLGFRGWVNSIFIFPKCRLNMQFGDSLKDLTWISDNLIIYQGVKTKITPMVGQYLDAKKQAGDALLLFRMGDFYEAFFEDAKTLSRVLDLALTSRTKGEEGGDMPMSGVPVRSINEYLFQLVEQGYRVAVCDQLEEASQAVGIVKRGITQIVTPGTLFDERPGCDRSTRFLTAVVWGEGSKGARGEVSLAIASIDLSTGYCTMTALSSAASLSAEIQRLSIREIISHHSAHDGLLEKALGGVPVQYRERDAFSKEALGDYWQSAADSKTALSKEKFDTFLGQIDAMGFGQGELVADAFCGLFRYLVDLRYPLTANIEQIYPYRGESFMHIDASTFQNLEIYATLRGGQRRGALLGEIDDTVTGPGARLLQNWLAYPLKDLGQIAARHDAVQDLFDNYEVREAVRRILGDIADLERLSTKIANDKVTPRDFVMLKRSLQTIPAIVAQCEQCSARYFRRAASQLNPLEDFAQHIDMALIEEAPANLNDTGYFKRGFDEQLDHFREIAQNGQQWLLDYEASQRQATGIASLKVKYQRVFGYFIEVTKSNMSLVPSSYIRSQTLTNCERFYTSELKEYEEELLGAESRRVEREQELYVALKQKAAGYLADLVKNARILAHIDVLGSLAHTAHHRQYTRPILDDSRTFTLLGARHPVVERFLAKGERFVPNDMTLDDAGRFMIITGPNMAGKSTVIRQAAIIALMAQMGSFVPADSARLGVVDRIFSRVGASDNLALGQSTFMVEMTETANILANATDRSLVILDEIGRGTSTYDGLSLAWAIAEFLHTNIAARALFATHYHELTELENVLPGIKNCAIAVKEYKGDIIFLRKLVDGSANRSYGIQVAKLAGLPGEVIARAERILETLEQNAHRELVKEHAEGGETVPQKAVLSGPQRSLFSSGAAPESEPELDPKFSALLEEFRHLTLDAMTPIQAMNWLYKWQRRVR